MPIHRHGHQLSSSVYAFRSELDAWWLSRDQPEAAADVHKPPIATSRRPFDISAQELYRMARDEWNSQTVDGIRRSLALARQVTERDPEHGQAHAMQALAGVVLASYTPELAARPMALARQAARRAVELDESLADAHTALGLIQLAYDWRWVDAEQSLRRTIELAPQDATAWSWLGFWRISRGDLEQALVDTRHAERLDPESLIIKTQVAWVLYFMRRYAEALDQLEKALAADLRFWRAYLNAGWCYMAMGRSEDAVRALEMAYALNDISSAAHCDRARTRAKGARKRCQDGTVERRVIGSTHLVLLPCPRTGGAGRTRGSRPLTAKSVRRERVVRHFHARGPWLG